MWAKRLVPDGCERVKVATQGRQGADEGRLLRDTDTAARKDDSGSSVGIDRQILAGATPLILAKAS